MQNKSDDRTYGLSVEILRKSDNKFEQFVGVYNASDLRLLLRFLQIDKENFHKVAEHCGDTYLRKQRYTSPPPKDNGH